MLTAWLGWYYLELAAKRPDLASARKQKIEACRRWIEAHADSRQRLPEQIAENLNVPSYYSTWVERWGDIASPLLWSHAKYIILCRKNLFDLNKILRAFKNGGSRLRLERAILYQSPYRFCGIRP